MGPCAKQRVVAHVVVRGKDAPIIGENVCLTPQTTCPRVPGEGYAKCYTHCTQLGHAEDVALRQTRLAGYLPADILAIRVYNHSGPCDNCRALLDSVGLLQLTTFYPGEVPATMTPATQQEIAAAYQLNAPSSHSAHAPSIKLRD